jgi:predicted RNase H-like HicB family nuclease
MPRYLVVVEPAGAGFSAYAPDLPGCVATGATREEARARLLEALAFHRAGLAEDEGA